MSYIRITPEKYDNPGAYHVVKNDRIEFVDDDGKATDISSSIQSWSTTAQVSETRKVTLTTLHVAFA